MKIILLIRYIKDHIILKLFQEMNYFYNDNIVEMKHFQILHQVTIDQNII